MTTILTPPIKVPRLPYGVVLGLTAGDTSFGIEIQRADDDGAGAPDTATATTIAVVSGDTPSYIDVRPRNSARLHYRARHVLDGWGDGDWTRWVHARPVPVLGDFTAQTARLALRNFRESARTSSQVTYTWDEGAAAFVTVHKSTVAQDASASPGWPTDSSIPELLEAGTTTYTVDLPTTGNVLYLQFEPRGDDGTAGPVIRIELTSADLPVFVQLDIPPTYSDGASFGLADVRVKVLAPSTLSGTLKLWTNPSATSSPDPTSDAADASLTVAGGGTVGATGDAGADQTTAALNDIAVAEGSAGAKTIFAQWTTSLGHDSGIVNFTLTKMPRGLDAKGDVLASALVASAQNYASNLTWSATDADTVAWTSGSIRLTDGTTYSIDAGNTGNMLGLTYVYLDTDVSSTVLQTSTTYSDAVGDNKILLALASAAVVGDEAFFVPGVGVLGLNGDQLSPNSIQTNHLQANSVTAAKISVASLSAISADIGTVTAGKIQDSGATAGVLLSSTVPGTWTRYLNLVDSGNPFLKYERLTLKWSEAAVTVGDASITATGITEDEVYAVLGKFETSDTTKDHFCGLFYTSHTAATAFGVNAIQGYTRTSHGSGTTDGARGALGQVDHAGAGTLTWARGVQGGGLVSAGAVTNFASLYAANIGLTGGSVNNQYGLFVDSPTQGSDNWSIYTSGTALSRFGGDIDIEKDTPSIFFKDTSGTAQTWNIGTNGTNDYFFISDHTGSVNAVRIEKASGGVTAVKFPNLGTTASAANAFIDSGSNERLLRSTSSLRYKTNVRTMEERRATSLLSALRPVLFRSKADADNPERTFAGFIAEEVWEIPGEGKRYVHLDSEGLPDGVAYAQLTAPLVAGWQEHESRLAALENENRELRALVEAMRN